jgi:hypothetical protein
MRLGESDKVEAVSSHTNASNQGIASEPQARVTFD